MNSFPFISHHLFVSAAGHENRPQVKAPRDPVTVKEPDGRLAAPEVPAKRIVQADVPRQLELLAGVAGAG